MPADKARSLRALDALNFCNAGIQTGLGPFMAIFYTSARHWNPGQIGILIACQSLAGILVQPAAGHLVDESHHKRLITATAAIVVAFCAAGIALLPQFAVQVAVQLTIGLAITVFPAATSAFALGMSEENEVPARIARNESFTHFGNASYAVVAGLTGTLISLMSLFFAAAVFASGMALAVAFLRNEHVNYEAAREGSTAEGDNKRTAFLDLIRDKRILIFTASVVLFNVSNQATLPLVAQILTKDHHGSGSVWQVASAVFVAELVMSFVARYAGGKAQTWGRKPLFLIAFAFLALRNGLTIVNHNPYYLIGLQSMDGVAAAIYGVLLTLVTADLGKGTGRFNFVQGAIQSSMGLGGFLSNSAFGFVAKTAGFNASFAGLSAAAIAGGVLYQTRMPETRPTE